MTTLEKAKKELMLYIIVTTVGFCIAVLATLFLAGTLQFIVTMIGIFMMVGPIINKLFKGGRNG